MRERDATRDAMRHAMEPAMRCDTRRERDVIRGARRCDAMRYNGAIRTDAIARTRRSQRPVCRAELRKDRRSIGAEAWPITTQRMRIPF